MPKRTFQPKHKRAKRKYGFLTRMKSKDGRDMIARKRTKGKKKLGA